MKKIIIIALAVLLAAVMCAPAYADVINSNHYVDFQRFNSDESIWDVFGWSVVDTEIVRVGYMIDGEDPVWIIDDIDERDNAKDVKPNDCFIDNELHGAVANGSMANGLAEFFAYRIHITLDATKIEKGMHEFEIIAEYESGDYGNPFRDTILKIEKTVDAIVPDESDSDESDPVESDPVDSDPVDSDPDDSDPDESDPDESDPDESDPDESDPVVIDPVESDDEPSDPVDLSRADINGDGEANNKDVVLLFRYVSDPNSDKTDPKYDFNADGGVNNKDVVSLFRAVSKK